MDKTEEMLAVSVLGILGYSSNSSIKSMRYNFVVAPVDVKSKLIVLLILKILHDLARLQYTNSRCMRYLGSYRILSTHRITSYLKHYILQEGSLQNGVIDALVHVQPKEDVGS